MATPAINYTENLRQTKRWNFVSNGLSYPQKQEDYLVGQYARKRPKSVSGGRHPDGSWTNNPWSVEARGMITPLASGKLRPIFWGPGTYNEYNSSPILGASLPDWFYPPDNLRGEAINKVLTKLRDNKVNLGVALAEARQTAEFVANNMNRMRRVLESAFSKNPREWISGVRHAGSGRWKKVPNYYLENCYALNPLISDIHGSAEALANAYERGLRPCITADAFARSGIEAMTHIPGTDVRTELTWGGESSYHVGVTADVPGWVMRNLNELGLTNPFEVMWEKIPYSFVVDQVIPIGNWIGTWDVSNYLTFRDGFITRRVDAQAVAVYRPTQNTAQWEISEDSPGKAWSFWLDRKRLIDFPTPVFPSLRNPLKLDNVAKAAALLTQLVGRHKKLANTSLTERPSNWSEYTD